MIESSCSSDTSDDDIPTDLNSSSDESIVAPPYSPVAYDSNGYNDDDVIDEDDGMDDASGRFTK